MIGMPPRSHVGSRKEARYAYFPFADTSRLGRLLGADEQVELADQIDVVAHGRQMTCRVPPCWPLASGRVRQRAPKTQPVAIRGDVSVFMVLVNDGVPLPATNQGAIDRERERPRDHEATEERQPEA